MKEKAEMMKVAVKNGITSLSDIRARYNEFAEGGDTNPYTVGATVDALYASNPREEFLGEPSHHYDFTQSEEWADAHGYYPDARGHRDDRVKKPAHPSHPSRGTWNGDKFELTDFGMQNPNYTLFGLNDGGQDPQAILTYKGGIVLPEITVTPKENYVFNPYDNIILHQKALGGNLYDKGGAKNTRASWYQQHQGKWYSFLRNKGVSDADAQRLSGLFTAQDGLESAGGQSSAARQKNNFGGMQRNGKNISYDSVDAYMEDKWKMMNSRFKPALSAQSIDEYATILGNPDTAGKGYLYYVTDSTPYDPKSPQWKAAQTQHMHNYINGMRSWAGQKNIAFSPVQYPQLPASLAEARQEMPAFMPMIADASGAPLTTYEKPVIDFPVQETVIDYDPKELEREERRERLNNLTRFMSMLSDGNSSSPYDYLDTTGLIDYPFFKHGGKIHIKPENRGKFTRLKERTGHSASWFKAHGTPAQKKMAVFELNARHWKHGLGGHLFDGTSEPTQQMEIQMPAYYHEADATRVAEKPMTLEPLKMAGWEDAALGRAKQGNVYSNYDEAKDAPLGWLNTRFRNGLRFLQDRGLNPLGSGISNCTLTTSQWVDPSNPIKNAESIVKNPEKYNYIPIDSTETIPGNMLISRNPDNNTYHTMLITGFAGQDSIVNFDGKNYNVKKGEPLLTYSRGGHDQSFLRRNIPISAYTPNSDGKTENHFFKYNYPREVFLPEITVFGNKRK